MCVGTRVRWGPEHPGPCNCAHCSLRSPRSAAVWRGCALPTPPGSPCFSGPHPCGLGSLKGASWANTLKYWTGCQVDSLRARPVLVSLCPDPRFTEEFTSKFHFASHCILVFPFDSGPQTLCVKYIFCENKFYSKDFNLCLKFFLKTKKHMNVCKKEKGRRKKDVFSESENGLREVKELFKLPMWGRLHSPFTAIGVVNAEKYTDYSWQTTSLPKNLLTLKN